MIPLLKDKSQAINKDNKMEGFLTLPDPFADPANKKPDFAISLVLKYTEQDL